MSHVRRKVRRFIEPLKAAAARAVGSMVKIPLAGGAGNARPLAAFEALEQRVMMAAQPMSPKSAMTYDAAGNNTVIVYATLSSAPATLTATAVSTGEIDLAWTNTSNGASGFEIQRSVSGSNVWNVINTVGKGSQSYADVTVAEGSAYQYRVLVTKGGSKSTLTNTATAATRPAAPSGLTVTPVSATQLNLAWTNNSAHASQFVLERSTNGTTFTSLATLNAGQTTYSDTSLAETTGYSYRVKTISAAGTTSDYSNVTSATTSLKMPSNLTATAVSPTRVDLSWTDNSTHETGYVVQRSENGGTFLSIASLNPNTASYTETVSEAHSYVYRVHAIYNGGVSADSNSASITTRPAAPTGLAANSTAAGSITLTWTDASNGELAYRVERSNPGVNDFHPVGTVDAGITILVDSTNLAPGSHYVYRVVAVGAGGESVSDLAVATTRTSPVTNLVAQTVSENAVSLSWTAPNGAESFLVQRSTNGVVYTDVGTINDPTQTFFNDTQLTEGVAYYYAVTAINVGGPSAAAGVMGITRPNAPSGLQATATPASVSLSWSDNSSGETGYLIERSTDGNTWVTVGTAGVNAENFVDADVAEGTIYSYRVTATAGPIHSNPSGTATATTVPSQVSGVAVAADGSDKVNVGWSLVSGATGYRVMRSDNGGGSFSQVGVDQAGNASSFVDTTVAEATAYQYEVVAFNAAGAGAASAAQSVTTFAAAPTDMQVDFIGTTTISVSWSDNSSGEGHYTVYRAVKGSGVPAAVVATLDPDSLFYSDSDIAPNTTYTYYVTATNGAGESAPTETVDALTLTAAPTGLAVQPVAGSSSTLNVSWTAVAGSTLGYKIYRDDGDGNGFHFVNATAAGVTTYVDTGLTKAKLYTYKVTAINGTGESDQSDVQSAMTV